MELTCGFLGSPRHALTEAGNAPPETGNAPSLGSVTSIQAVRAKGRELEQLKTIPRNPFGVYYN